MKNKTLIKTLSAILAVIMVLGSAPLSGFTGIELPDLLTLKAEAVTYSGLCGDNIYWSLDTETGVLDITGTGTMNDYTSSSIPWYSDRSYIRTVNISDGITSIGKYAFYNCTSFTSVTIGNSVKSIGSNAFYKCTSLARVYYTGDIEDWCNISFGYYDANPMSYAKNFYINNTFVKEIVIPETITEIKNYAFYSFEGITSVTISDSVESIGKDAFYKCTSLTSVTIPDSVTSIGYEAFSSCKSLASVTIPDSVTSIGYKAFENCTSLTSVTIGNSVTGIGSFAFAYCISLTDVYYKGDIESWCNISFGGEYANPMYNAKNFYIDNTLVKEIVIPDTITEIKNYVFNGFKDITSVTIPNSVTRIGSGAFYDCTSLKELTIPVSAKIYNSSNVFYNCSNIEKVTLTKGNGVMQNYFYGSGNDDTYYRYTPWYISRKKIKEIIIEDGVESIGYYAFCDCTSLTSVTIPDSVTSIDSYAFDNCTSLTEVCYTGDIEDWCNISFGYYDANPMSYAEKFYFNGEFLENLIIPNDMITIKTDVFYGFDCIKTVTIPESVVTIRQNAFSGCKNINSVIYEGSEAQWDEIVIYDGNDYLVNAERTYLNGGHEHVYTSSVTTAPTCIEDGIKTFECSCGDSYTESISATDHKYGAWEVITEPTMTEAGEKVRKCSCGAAETGVEPATGITVTATDADGKVVKEEVVSGETTEISYENIADGEYTVTVSKETYTARKYTVTATDGTASVEFSLNKTGDMNGDGKINAIDVARANAHAKGAAALSGYELDCVDVNGDGKVNAIDVAFINAHSKGVKSLW